MAPSVGLDRSIWELQMAAYQEIDKAVKPQVLDFAKYMGWDVKPSASQHSTLSSPQLNAWC